MTGFVNPSTISTAAGAARGFAPDLANTSTREGPRRPRAEVPRRASAERVPKARENRAQGPRGPEAFAHTDPEVRGPGDFARTGPEVHGPEARGPRGSTVGEVAGSIPAAGVLSKIPRRVFR